MGKWKACTCAMGNSNPSETSLYLDRRLSDFQSWLIAEERRVTSLVGVCVGGGGGHSRLQGTCLTSSPYRCPFTVGDLAHQVFSILQTSLTQSLPGSLLSIVNVFENSNVTSRRTGGFPRHSHLGCILEDKSSQLPLLTSGADTQVPNIQISGAGDHGRETKTQMPRMHCLCKFWHFLHIPPCHSNLL